MLNQFVFVGIIVLQLPGRKGVVKTGKRVLTSKGEGRQRRFLLVRSVDFYHPNMTDPVRYDIQPRSPAAPVRA